MMERLVMQPIRSMIEFKQIIGRGTRLYDGKVRSLQHMSATSVRVPDPRELTLRRVPLAHEASIAQQRERFVDAFDGNDADALDRLLGPIRRRNDRRLEAKLRCFADTVLTALDRANFTCQSDFTKNKRFSAQWLVFK